MPVNPLPRINAFLVVGISGILLKGKKTRIIEIP